MATVFDLGGLVFFLPIFVFLFIFVVLYAVLEKTQLFGDKARALNVIAAFSVAIISIFTGKLVNLVAFITPWIALMIIVMLFLFAIFVFFNVEAKPGVLGKGIGKHTFWGIIGETPVFVILLIIVFIGITSVFEEDVSPYQVVNEDGEIVSVVPDDGGDVNPRSEAMKALTHPRLLSALFLLIIASVAMKFIVDKYEP